MKQLDLFEKIIVDNFAGGGGASTGIELACGRPVTIAINHDPDAILLHRTNHPYTEHLSTPSAAAQGDFLLFSGHNLQTNPPFRYPDWRIHITARKQIWLHDPYIES